MKTHDARLTFSVDRLKASSIQFMVSLGDYPVMSNPATPETNGQ